MTGGTIDKWVFQPLTSLTDEQEIQWLEKCYLRSQCDLLFQDRARSAIVITDPGSGLSTSMFLAARAGFLTFSYTPDQWPGQPYALIKTPDLDHFSQFMAQIAQLCTDKIRSDPKYLAECPAQTYEFLYWLVLHYLGRRRADLWLRYLQQHVTSETQTFITQAQQGIFDTLYGNESVNDIYGQIDECLGLAECLGWNGIYALIEINIYDWIQRSVEDRAMLRDGLERLLRSLTLIQRPGFGFKLGVPMQMLSVDKAEELARGRATVITYTWTPNELDMLTQRMLQTAAGDQDELQFLTRPSFWKTIEPDIYSIWGQKCPAAISAVLRFVLEINERDGWTSSQENVLGLRQRLYQSHALLRRDAVDPSVVWRGATPLPLDDAQQRIFAELWRHGGHAVQNSALLPLAGSRPNLDKIISRIRQAIEPLAQSRTYLYLMRSNSQGMWLEKSMCAFHSGVRALSEIGPV